MIEQAMREAQDAVPIGALEEALATGLPQLVSRVVDEAFGEFDARLEGATLTVNASGVSEQFAAALASGAGASELCVKPAEWPIDDDAARWSTSRGAAARPSWESELTASEVSALESWTRGNKWGPLNTALREGVELPDDLAEMARLIDSAIVKAGTYAPDARPIVWRGVNLGSQGMPRAVDMIGLPLAEREELVRASIANYAEKRFVAGAVVEMKGYQSSSFLIEPALSASLGRTSPGIVFEIRAKSGAYLDKISKLDDEAELLLGRDSSFRVIKVLRDVPFEVADGTLHRRTVVQLEQVR